MHSFRENFTGALTRLFVFGLENVSSLQSLVLIVAMFQEVGVWFHCDKRIGCHFSQKKRRLLLEILRGSFALGIGLSPVFLLNAVIKSPISFVFPLLR